LKLAHLNQAVNFAKDFSLNGDVKKKTSLIPGSENGTAGIQPAAPTVRVSIANPSGITNNNGQPLASAPNGNAVKTSAPAAPPTVVPPVTSPTAINNMPPVPTVNFPPPLVVEEPSPSRAPDRNVPLPGAKKMVKMPSLKDIQTQLNNPTVNQQETAVTQQEEISTGPAATVSPDALQTAWRELTSQKRNEGKMMEFIILDRPVTLNEKLEILLQVENPVQVDQFNEFRAEFLAALRQRLRNNRLNVRLEVKEQQGGRKLYTSQDKFNYLSEKHPILPELRKRLMLDTDF